MKKNKLPNGGVLIEHDDGTKQWFLNGRFHREDGPAFEGTDGFKSWFINDLRHREDGPAIEYANGNKSWYINGKKVFCSSQEEFERLMKLKALW